MEKEGEDKDNLDKFEDELNQKAFEAYKDKSKDFSRAFGLLLAFGTVFFFIIFLPYIFIQDKEYRFAQEINNTNLRINQIQRSIEGVQNASDGIQLLQQKVEDMPIILRSFISDINKGVDIYTDSSLSNTNATQPSSPQQQTNNGQTSLLQQQTNQTSSPQEQVMSVPAVPAGAYPECGERTGDFPENTDWISCNVQKEVQRLFGNYHEILEKNVTNPLQFLNEENQTQAEKLKWLEEGVAELEKNFNGTLAANSDFWKCYDCVREIGLEFPQGPISKQELANILTQHVQTFWETYLSPIEEEIGERGPILAGLRQEGERQRETMDTLNDTKTQIAERLNQIEFPFGKVPLALGESLAAFPLLLGAGFLICSPMLCNSIRLRKELYERYKNKRYNSQLERLLSQRIATVAPLWIDPTGPLKYQIVKFTILVIPFIIFVVSWVLISYSWNISDVKEMEEVFPYESDLVKNVYTSLYVISLGFFIFGFAIIIRELRRYSIQ
jgi:cell division protein FtsL